ncbi:hypothetical protein R1sor_011055 [Riccia sorocarpa]|uniref:Large ribosomal subunit protein bL28m n=1 Tax=Riccia sorocarpa TaxID=122646 RepID=A0ABD3I5U6_9MARC
MSSRVVTVMSRAKRGLYAGRHIQFGNKVSEDGGNKSRRTWKPNVQSKRLFSLALDKYIRVNVTTHALRCIDKAGGIDEYLLKIPDRKVENETALFWKHQIAAIYEALANTEIAIPVQNPEESAFSMEVLTEALPGVGDLSKTAQKSSEVKVTKEPPTLS